MIKFLRIVIYFAIFVLLQVLVMNQIHLFSIVTPLIYLYIILKLPVDMSRSTVIFISFLTGLVIDIFSNTFGMHAAASTLAGLARMPLILQKLDMKEVIEGSVPSYNLFGFGNFLRYTLFLVSVHHIALFSIEAFSFFNVMMIVRIFAGIVVSTMLILIIEAFNLTSEKSGD